MTTFRPTPSILFIALSVSLVCLAAHGQANTPQTTSIPPLDRFAIIPDRVRVGQRSQFPTALLNWPWRNQKKKPTRMNLHRRTTNIVRRGPH